VAFFVYVVECSDGSYYTGHTENLEARLAAHNDGRFKGYTFKRRPVKLVFSDTFMTRDEAFRAERQIKGWRRLKKQALMREDWEALKVLARTAKTPHGTKPPQAKTYPSAHGEPVEP